MGSFSVLRDAVDHAKSTKKVGWLIAALLFGGFTFSMCNLFGCGFKDKGDTQSRVVYVLGRPGDTSAEVNEDALNIVAKRTVEVIKENCSSEGFLYGSKDRLECISNPLALFYDSSSKTLRIGNDVVNLQGVRNLEELDNINLADLKEGQVLQYDGQKWVNRELSSALPECLESQTLKWQGGRWVCATLNNAVYRAGTGLTLNGTTFAVKVPATGCGSGKVLSWDGSQFVCVADQGEDYSAGTGLKLENTTFSLNANIGLLLDVDTNTTPPTNGQVLKWNGSKWVPANDETGSGVVNGTTTNSTLRWDGSSWVENTNFTVDENGIVTSGTWHGSVIDISDYTNLVAGNGINLNGDSVEINAPTCSGTDKLQWNGSSFVCAVDQDTTYSAGTGLQLTGTTFSLNAGIDLLTDVDTTTNAPTIGQVLKWDGTNWVPGDDADTDTLTSLSCSNGQIAKWDGSSWVCAADEDTDTTYSAGNGLQLNSTTFSIDAPTCSGTDKLTWDGTQFVCAADQDTDTTYAAGRGLTLTGTTFDTNTPTSACPSGQVLTWDGDNFTCVADQDTTYSAGNGLSLSGTTFSVNAPTCNGTDKLKWDGTQFVCESDEDTLTSLSCSNGQVAKWNGSAWVCSNDNTGTELPSGTITNSTLRWNGSSWVENTNFTVDENGIVTSGTWHGSVIDISDYTNLAAGNGINLNGDSVEINAPTCNGTDKLQWNGSSFVCAVDQDTTYSAGTGLQLTGTTFSLNAGIDLLTDVDTTTNAPTIGQVLKWDGSNWVPGDDAGGSGALPAGTSGQTLRHDGTGWIASSALYNDGVNIGIGTANPNTRLSVVVDDGNGAAVTKVASYYHASSNGTPADGIGIAQSYYTDTQNSTQVEVGRLEFVAHIAQDGTAGDSLTNNASFFRLYVERETWDDFTPLLAGYVTGGDRLLCMNGTESNDMSQWDCFGMTIGSANEVTYWFDRVKRAGIGLDGADSSVYFAAINPGDALKFKTLGGQPLRFDAGNNGNDLVISPAGNVGIGLDNPASATLVVSGTIDAQDTFVDNTTGVFYSHYNFEGQYVVPAGSGVPNVDYVGIQLNPSADISESVAGVAVGTRSVFNISGQSPGSLYIAKGIEMNSIVSGDIYMPEFRNISSEVSISGNSSVETLYGMLLVLVDDNGNTGEKYGLYVDGFDMNFIGGKLGLGYSDYPNYTLELPNDPSDGVAIAYQWATYSDARVKTNQKDLHYGLDTIMELRPKEYIHHTAFFKDGKLVLKDGKKDIGLIAQEVDKVLPEAVKRPRSAKDLWGLDYEKFVPVLIKAVQELAGKVEKVEKQQDAFVVKKTKGRFVVPSNVSVFSVKYSELTVDDMVLLTPSGSTPVAFSVEVLDGEFRLHLKEDHPAVEFKYLIVK